MGAVEAPGLLPDPCGGAGEGGGGVERGAGAWGEGRDGGVGEGVAGAARGQVARESGVG